jgi:hypothetical protein
VQRLVRVPQTPEDAEAVAKLERLAEGAIKEQANVQVEQTGEARVRYERAEPQVTVNQAEGQPKVTIEQVQDQQGASAQDQQAQTGVRECDQLILFVRDNDTDATGITADRARQIAEQREAAACQEALAAAQAGTDTSSQQQGTRQDAEQQRSATDQADEDAASAAQRAEVRVSELTGMQAVNARGQQIGEVEGVVRSESDSKLYVVIDHGGFLGLGEKRFALSLEGMRLGRDRLISRAFPTTISADSGSFGPTIGSRRWAAMKLHGSL